MFEFIRNILKINSFYQEINYSNSLIKGWNEDVGELIKSKQKKSKILSKIQNKIKEVIPKHQRAMIWKQVSYLIIILFYIVRIYEANWK